MKARTLAVSVALAAAEHFAPIVLDYAGTTCHPIFNAEDRDAHKDAEQAAKALDAKLLICPVHKLKED